MNQLIVRHKLLFCHPDHCYNRKLLRCFFLTPAIRYLSRVPRLAKKKSSMPRRHRTRLRANTVPVSGQQGDSLQDEPLREAQVYCQMLNILYLSSLCQFLVRRTVLVVCPVINVEKLVLNHSWGEPLQVNRHSCKNQHWIMEIRRGNHRNQYGGLTFIFAKIIISCDSNDHFWKRMIGPHVRIANDYTWMISNSKVK